MTVDRVLARTFAITEYTCQKAHPSPDCAQCVQILTMRISFVSTADCDGRLLGEHGSLSDGLRAAYLKVVNSRSVAVKE